MHIWNGILDYPDEARPAVATIGNYDGVHLGHRAILERVVSHAKAEGLPSLLLTFEPHPLKVVAPERQLRLLQTRRQKLENLRQAGLGAVLWIRFTEQLAELDGETFFSRVLEDRVPLAAVHVGENFRFGRGRRGDLSTLRNIGERLGFAVHPVPAVRVDGEPVSSSATRAAIQAGDVERARRLLGRPYAVSGEVIRGEGRGRRLYWPTANMEPDNELLPRPGVYITETEALADRRPSVTNVGFRPTFLEKILTVETHVLDFDEDLYQQRIEVRFLARLRDEMQFDSTTELADQIARDCAAAEMYFQTLRLEAP